MTGDFSHSSSGRLLLRSSHSALRSSQPLTSRSSAIGSARRSRCRARQSPTEEEEGNSGGWRAGEPPGCRFCRSSGYAVTTPHLQECASARAFAREKHAHVSLGLDLSERVADALEDFVPVHGNPPFYVGGWVFVKMNGPLPFLANSATVRGMTVEEIKAETAKLPPDARFALAEWIKRSDDVRALRHEELIRALQHGIDQADRGELLESDEVFARLRAGQRASA